MKEFFKSVGVWIDSVVAFGIITLIGLGIYADTLEKAQAAPSKVEVEKAEDLLLDMPLFVPEEGMVAKCLITRVVDGDTVDVEITVPMRIRLLGIDAPEMNKPGGKESYENLKWKAEGQEGKVQIPWDDVNRFGGIMSFDRVLGYVWVGQKNMSAQQIRDNHAKHRGK